MEPQAISSDLIRGHIDTIILYSLIDNDKFAQQISDSIEEKSNKEYKMNQATLYSSLKRLENLKLVTSYWNDSASGRRKFFKLTEKGKETVDTNLSNWSYSRSIIDRLMDCEPTSLSQTKVIEVEKVVEKIVEVPVVKEVIKEVEVPVIKEVTKTVTISEPSIAPLTQPVQTTIQPKEEQKVHVESSNELNFRNILSGIIGNSNQTQQIIDEEVSESSNIENVQLKPIEKSNLNDTLNVTEYNPNKTNQTGKIDFGDLTLKAKKEGYKLRVSSRESYYQVGNLLINKLKLVSSFAIFLIAILEMFFVVLAYQPVVNIDLGAKIITLVVLAIFPISMLAFYIKSPQKTTSDKVKVDSILTSAIIVFNLLLITLAANLLIGIDFSNVNVILFSGLIPCLLFVDILIYYVIKYFIAKLTFFAVENKK